MKRDEKEKIVSVIAEKLKRAPGIYLTDFQGLTVEQSSKLRNEFRKAGVEYKVVKNTLIKKAMQSANVSDKLFPALKKTTGIAFGYDDPLVPAKIIKKFSADNEKFKFKAASIEGAVFQSNQLDAVAGMMGRAENIARAIGMVNQVIAGVPGTLNAVMRGLVYVISEGKKAEAGAA